MTVDLLKPEHSRKAAYLKKIGKYRVAGKKFLTYGELVDLIDHTDTISEPWTTPIVQGAVWKAEDGSLGVFFVNHLEKESVMEWTIDPEKYGLEPRGDEYAITRIGPEGRRLEDTVPGREIRRTEALGPWEVRILEIRVGAESATVSSG